jgi:transcription antitermination factor NusG
MSQIDFEIEKIPDKIWMVVKTKARCEKKFAKYCQNFDVLHYLPLRRSVKRYKNRKVEFRIPMFYGYVFAQINPDDKLLLQQPRYSSQIITPDRRAEENLIKELNDIKILIDATEEGNLEVFPEIQVGKAICIKSGVLAGLNGIVIRRNNKMRITVNVEMVGSSVSVDLDIGEVEIDS